MINQTLILPNGKQVNFSNIEPLNTVLLHLMWTWLQDQKSRCNLIENESQRGLQACQQELRSAWFCDVVKIFVMHWYRRKFEEQLQWVNGERRKIQEMERTLRAAMEQGTEL